MISRRNHLLDLLIHNQFQNLKLEKIIQTMKDIQKWRSSFRMKLMMILADILHNSQEQEEYMAGKMMRIILEIDHRE